MSLCTGKMDSAVFRRLSSHMHRLIRVLTLGDADIEDAKKNDLIVTFAVAFAGLERGIAKALVEDANAESLDDMQHVIYRCEPKDISSYFKGLAFKRRHDLKGISPLRVEIVNPQQEQ